MGNTGAPGLRVALLEELQPALRGQHDAHGPLAALTWRLNGVKFDATVTELSRARDDAAIRMLILQLRRDGVSLMRSGASQATTAPDLGKSGAVVVSAGGSG